MNGTMRGFGRRNMLTLSAYALAGLACRGNTQMQTPTHTETMPVLFIGHGNPMNAITDTPYGRAWQALGAAIPKPRAILCVSAHWYVDGTHVTSNASPRTIHDFGGFPRPLFEVQYPARGDDALATRIATLLAAHEASPSDTWGLDHGTWSVLVHLRPDADVPVLQLSIDRRAPAATHLAIGRALAPLRQQGILILGSGNITHNLGHAMRSRGEATPAWASEVDTVIARAVTDHDSAPLTRLLDTDAGRMSHPTPDHYFPLLYAVGAATERDAVSFPVTGFDLGSLSMRSIRFG
jgi:4,5-DOPA dioxygenase extradiol